jgi:hypothetical protein
MDGLNAFGKDYLSVIDDNNKVIDPLERRIIFVYSKSKLVQEMKENKEIHLYAYCIPHYAQGLAFKKLYKKHKLEKKIVSYPVIEIQYAKKFLNFRQITLDIIQFTQCVIFFQINMFP